MLERKAFRLRVKQLDETGMFDGYASVFGNTDSYGDIVDRGAFAKTIGDKAGRFPILWQHNPDEPIGVSTGMVEDMHGLAVTGQLNLDTQRGREAYSLLRQGALQGLSIGYQTVNSVMDGKTRRLTEVKLWEFSVVTFPANELATVTGVKGAAHLELAVAWAAAEVKAGRVLSAQNRVLVETARDALNDLLAASEPAAADDATPMVGAGMKQVEPGVPTPLASLYIFGKEALT